MKILKLIGFVLIVLTFALFVSGQSTVISYQGNLSVGSAPANGNFDFEFRLFDAASGGMELGAALSRNAVPITNGTFAVSLDFGSQFPGAQRYLEIRVRPAGSGSFTPLAPRQPITSAPYSIKSISAENATNATNASTATNALQLGGVAANQYLLTNGNGSGLTNLNAGNITTGTLNPGRLGNGVILNTTTQQPTSNFDISGTGTANIFNAGTQFNIGGNRILSGPGGNLFAGFGSGSLNTTGQFNTYIGSNAGAVNNSGQDNTFVGYGAGINNTSGRGNSAFGNEADFGAANLMHATALGHFALVSQSNSLVLGSIHGVNGCLVGSNGCITAKVGIGTTAPTERLHVEGNSLFTGNLNISGTGTANILNGLTQYNLAGQRVLFAANANVFVGPSVGNFSGANAINNAIVGNSAGFSLQFGSNNAFLGFEAGRNNSNGSSNTFIGAGAGSTNESGLNNTAIGAGSGFAVNNLDFATAIGSGAVVNSSNTIRLGRPADTVQIPGNFNVSGTGLFGGNLGIGTSAPLASLDVRGSVFVGLTTAPSAGFVNAIFLQNDFGNTQNSFRLDAAENNLYIVARSPVGSASAAGIVFRTGADTGNPADSEVDRVTINPDGTVRIHILGSAGATSLCRNGLGQISTCSSSARYKSNINHFSSGLDIVRRLRPVSFNWREGGMLDMGLVAEEVAKIEPLLTTTNDKGEIEGVKYDRIGVVLVNAVKEQQTQIDLQQKLIEKQAKQIEALTRLVCQTNAADICNEKE